MALSSQRAIGAAIGMRASSPVTVKQRRESLYSSLCEVSHPSSV